MITGDTFVVQVWNIILCVLKHKYMADINYSSKELEMLNYFLGKYL